MDLNRAVAVSMARGPAAGLRIVDDLATDGVLESSHLLPTVRGELLSRLGRVDAARVQWVSALTRCRNDPERRMLERKLASLDDAEPRR